MVITNKIYLFI